uniref:Immunoglobulin domain-containing protein n=2 Tax=Cyprinus carpio TaxID=7962 RepID=A0A8C1PYK0_CYPCA
MQPDFIISMDFSCGNDTKIIQHLIYLLVWCQTVETLTELTHLGQNVSINCDLDEKEIYWMLLKLPNRPVMILRLFSTSPTPFYYDVSFRPKYSVQPSNRLFIKNVSTAELGIYYCMTTEVPPQFSNGIRLHITEPTKSPECQNHTVLKYVEQNHTVVNYTDQIQQPWMIIIIFSGLMHGILVFVVIGVCCYSREKLKHRETDIEQTQFIPLKQEPKTMYTEVVFSLMHEEFEQKRCFFPAAQIINRKACS